MFPARVALIAVALLALTALAPVTAQAADITSIGPQLRLTKVGADGNAALDAADPAVAYNSRDDEFLVAWVGDVSATAEAEIFGQVLDGSGAPKGDPQRLTEVPDSESPPSQPVLGYSPEINQYVLGYVATPRVITPAPDNSPAGQREIMAQIVTATGIATGTPARISDTDNENGDEVADAASSPALAYDPELDEFRFVWISDDQDPLDGTPPPSNNDFEVFTQRVSSSLAKPDEFGEVKVSTTTAGDAAEPAIDFLPAQDRWVVAWSGAIAASETEIFMKLLTVRATTAVAQAQISAASGTADASRPAVAANTARGEALVSFLKNDVAGEGPEAFVQRVSASGVQLPNAADQRISTMGPVDNLAFGASTSRNTTATYHAGLDRYVVTWVADNDFPGLVDNELERYGQALDGAGVEVGSDDFRISTAGPDGNSAAAPDEAATVAIPGRRAWFSVWDADDNRPPLADGEFEVYGRFLGDDGDFDGFTVPDDCEDANAGIHPGASEVLDNGVDEDCSGADAENLDRDADGSSRPADCDDGNAGIRPGAADTADNGVDEDCSGADAVNLDRDGDGSLRPLDCNDGTPAIRPGAVDTPRNGVDEDCSGKDAAFPTLTSGILPTWNVRGKRITLVGLQVTQKFPNGLAVKILCKGKKCPFKSKGLKLGKVKRAAANVIGSLKKKKRKFRAGQTVEVWVSAPGFNTKVSRFALKKGKVPKTQPFCVIPGKKKPRKDCTI